MLIVFDTIEDVPKMIIDFHAHIYPDKIAAKASAAIGEFYDAPMARHG